MTTAEAYKSAFAKRLRAALSDSSLSQTDLAHRLGLVPQSVQSWASGRTIPSQHRTADIASALGVSLAWLRDGQGNPDSLPAVAQPMLPRVSRRQVLRRRFRDAAPADLLETDCPCLDLANERYAVRYLPLSGPDPVVYKALWDLHRGCKGRTGMLILSGYDHATGEAEPLVPSPQLAQMLADAQEGGVQVHQAASPEDAAALAEALLSDDVRDVF
jgi:transcriptional regulator with XRE-family HTH domain